jgi:hypothetical protein
VKIRGKKHLILAVFVSIAALQVHSEERTPATDAMGLNGPVKEVRRYCFDYGEKVPSQFFVFDIEGYIIEDRSYNAVHTKRNGKWYVSEESWFIQKNLFREDHSICETLQYNETNGERRLQAKYISGDVFDDGSSQIYYDENGAVLYKMYNLARLDTNVGTRTAVAYEMRNAEGTLMRQYKIDKSKDGQWLSVIPQELSKQETENINPPSTVKKYLLYNDEPLLEIGYKNDSLTETTYYPSIYNDFFRISERVDSLNIYGNRQIPGNGGISAEFGYDGNADIVVDNEMYTLFAMLFVTEPEYVYGDLHKASIELEHKKSGNSIRVWLDESGEWHIAKFHKEIVKDDHGNWYVMKV